MFFDSHCHLTDPAFASDREGVVARAVAAGVAGMVTICSDVRDLDAILKLTNTHGELWGTAGIHPHEARHSSPKALERVREVAEGQSRIRAIGECGLDFHYDHSPRETQRTVFRAQLDLAEELGRPVVVHSRDADADTAHLIREYRGRVTGVPPLLHGRCRAARRGTGRRLVRLVLRDGDVPGFRRAGSAPHGAEGPASGGDRLPLPGADASSRKA